MLCRLWSQNLLPKSVLHSLWKSERDILVLGVALRQSGDVRQYLLSDHSFLAGKALRGYSRYAVLSS